MEAARWRLGPVRLAPWLGLRGLTWEQNVFVDSQNQTSDLTGAVGAGLTAYLPTGAHVYWIAQAMPEYLWWLDLSERNQLIGRYGGGVVADLNRLRLSADVRRSEQQGVVTIEAPQQVVHREEGVTVNAELFFTRILSFAVAASDLDQRSRLPGDVAGRYDFPSIDRNERRVSGELRYRPATPLTLGLGAERTETTFDATSRDLSGSGTSPFATLQLDGNHLQANFRVVRRQLDPSPGSELVPVDRTEGSGRLTLTPGWRFTVGVYGSRALTYALDTDYSHLTDERLGVEVGAPFGERLSARLFAETGSADFTPLDGAPRRKDDLTAYGAEATYKVGEWLSYRAGLHQVTIDSNLPGFDRDYLRVTSSFILSTGDWVWR